MLTTRLIFFFFFFSFWFKEVLHGWGSIKSPKRYFLCCKIGCCNAKILVVDLTSHCCVCVILVIFIDYLMTQIFDILADINTRNNEWEYKSVSPYLNLGWTICFFIDVNVDMAIWGSYWFVVFTQIATMMYDECQRIRAKF